MIQLKTKKVSINKPLYYGDASLKTLVHASWYFRQLIIPASILCCIVIAEFSFNAVVGFAAIFCEDNIYSFILFS